MVFKKMLQKIGVGGPSVDTVLHEPRCRPGALLSGEVRLVGGEADADIEHIALSLVARAGSNGPGAELHRVVVSGTTRLGAKEERTIPFSFALPWETPLTEVGGQPLPGISIGLRTELAIAKAVDKGDLDPVAVEPAPAQDAVLDAFGHLGFMFKATELKTGRGPGAHQEFEFYPPSQYAGRVAEVEVSILADRDGIQVILEADRRSGYDAGGRFTAGHEEARSIDWAELVGKWLDEVLAHQPMYSGYDHDDHDDHHGHHGHGGRRRGPGMGGVVAGAAAGAAAGVVGGMVLGEMLDGDDGGDEG
ncbi:sporulation protein [Amycolatopsis lurida]